MGHMSYRHFAAYNVVGALLWVLLFTYAGYLFGDLPVVQENLKLLIGDHCPLRPAGRD
jgi:membrane-associated protein